MVLVSRVLSVAKRGLCSQLVLIPKSQRFFCIKLSTSSLDSLLSRLLQAQRSQVKSTLDEEESFALKSSEFRWDALVSTLRSSSPEKAHLVLEWRLEKMLERNERDHDQYSDLISLCGNVQNVQLAMHVFTSMEAHEIKPTASVFNSLIHACLGSSNVITAFSLFEVMESSATCKPDAGTYDTFISGFSDLGNGDTMQKWYSAKKAAGFFANLQNYESLISGCVKSSDFDSADRYYEEMVLAGVMPSVLILENVLEGLSKRRSFDKVKEFLKFLLDVGWGINVNMVDKLVRLYSGRGKEEQMEELLVTLNKSKQDPEVLLRVHSQIIRMYANSGRLDDVEYSVGRMFRQGLSFRSADDVEKVISSYFRQEAYDRLDLFLERIKGCYQLTRSTYDLLVAGYRRVGLSEKLDLVIKDMESAGFL